MSKKMRYMEYKSCSHVLHLLITIFIWPWLLVWIFCASSVSRHNKRVEQAVQKEQIELLRDIAAQGKAIPDGVVK